MKYTLSSLLLGSMIALGSTHTMAQPAEPFHDGPPPRHAMQGDGMEHRWAEYAATLKDRLHITTTQESLWNDFVASMKPTKEAQDKHPDFKALAQLPTPERIERMRTLRKERELQLISRENAVKTFYAGLTSEQKKIFDAERPPRPIHESVHEPMGEPKHP